LIKDLNLTTTELIEDPEVKNSEAPVKDQSDISKGPIILDNLIVTEEKPFSLFQKVIYLITMAIKICELILVSVITFGITYLILDLLLKGTNFSSTVYVSYDRLIPPLISPFTELIYEEKLYNGVNDTH